MRFLKSNSRFQKNFLHILKSNILAQVVQLAAMPVLTRMFGPTSFAVLAVFTAILSIALSFCTLRFDWSVPNAKSERKAFDLILCAIVATVVFGIVFLILHKFAEPMLNQWQGYDLVAPYWEVLFCAVVTGAILQIFQGWFVHEADLKKSAQARMMNAISNTGYKLVGGWVLPTPGVLLWSTIFGNLCAIFIQINAVWQSWKALLKTTTRRHLAETFHDFAPEAALSSLVSLANAISLSVVPVLLATFYAPKELGWYALVNRLALTPLGLITSAVMQSFWAEAAKTINSDKRKLRKMYLQSSWRLAVLSVPVIIVCVCAPLYTKAVFGMDWGQAGYLLLASTPMIVGQIIVSPLSHLIVHGKQAWQLVWDIVRFMVLVALIILSANAKQNIYWTVFYVSAFSFLMYGVLFLMNYYFLSKEMKGDNEEQIVI